ncbi:MAG: hypothetical protein ACREMJ_01970 [Gemmatimonadales bacterium]
MGSRRTGHGKAGKASYRPWLAAAWLTLGLGALAAPAAARSRDADPPTRLVLDAGLLVRLRVLAAGLHHEIVFCLTGSLDGGTAVATGFVMPDPVRSEAEAASFGPCPAATIAIWHNHPLAIPPRATAATQPSYARPVGDPDASPRDLCALSDTDIRTAARDEYSFVVVFAGGDTWCWWTRDQVRKLAARNTLRGAPIPGQIEAYQPR